MMNLTNVRRNNAVAFSSQALNVFEGFFSYAYFYFYFFYQTLLRSLTRPAACLIGSYGPRLVRRGPFFVA